MRKLRRFFLLLSLLVAPARAEDIYWTQFIANVPISDQWSVFGEFQPRWIDHLDSSQVVLFRAAALYQISSELRVGLGYGMMPQYLPTPRNESRIFEQLDWTPPIADRWLFASRTRLEQRLLENAPNMSWRVREKLQLSWMPAKWGAYIWNEFFWNLNTSAGHVLSGFDQNRLSIGPRYHLAPVTIEAGYLLQTLRTVNKVTNWNAGVVISFSVVL